MQPEAPVVAKPMTVPFRAGKAAPSARGTDSTGPGSPRNTWTVEGDVARGMQAHAAKILAEYKKVSGGK